MFRMKVWLTASLITAGVVGGVVFNWPGSEPLINRESPIENQVDSNQLRQKEGLPLSSQLAESTESSNQEESLLVDLDIDHIQKGDQYLVVGNFDGAHREYAKATNEYRVESPATLLLRLAMALEQMGDTKNAVLFYQKAVRRSVDGSMTRLLALTGVARAWQNEGQLGLAYELLAELFLRYSSNENLHDEVQLQVAYQLGNVIQLKFLAELPMQRNAMDSLEFNWVGPSIDAMIEILIEYGDTIIQPTMPNSRVAEFVVLQRPSADVNLIAVDSIASLTPIEEILSQYSRQANLNFELSRAAKDIIEGRSSRLAVSGLPLALVLDQLLSPLTLVWIQSGETISVFQESEAGVDAQAYRYQLADRALRIIELSFPREIRRDSSLLHRGNLSLLNGDLTAAATRYLELQKLLPNNELAAKLSFNAAIVDINANLPDAAIKKLYFAVDQSLDQLLRAKSYAWIGRLELRHGRPDRAVYALSRGLSLAQNAHIRQDVLMNLAKAYLLENDPFSANRVLFVHADFVIDPAEKKKAAVFSAYARYLGTIPSEGLRNEGERMVVALASIRTEDANTFTDRLLIGRAFFEVGFTGRSNEFLEIALDAVPHEHWRRRVAFELATNQYRSGELVAATTHFETLLQGPPDATRLLAQLRLADIALSQKKPERCLEICQQIWLLDITEEQKVETLSLMGRSYQRLGRHQVAAICFSGMVPHEFRDRSAGTPNANTQDIVN